MSLNGPKSNIQANNIKLIMCFNVIQPLQVSEIQHIYIHSHMCTYGQASFTHACSSSLNGSSHSITASHTNASCSHMLTILTISSRYCMIHNSHNATFSSFLISRPTIGPDPKATTLHGQRIYILRPRPGVF